MMLQRPFLITLLIVAPVIAQAQDAAEPVRPVDEFVSVSSNVSDYELRKGQNEFGIWGGGAFNATTIFGGLRKEEAADRKYLILGLRYGRVLAAKPRAALVYTLDVIPTAIAFNTITADPPTGFVRENVWGAGLAPLGLKGVFGQSRVKGFAGVTGGGLIFRKPVPLPDAGRFAFTGDADGGVHIFTRPDRAITLGVKFHHISNGDRTGANRGLNQFIVFAGFSVFK